MGRTGSRRAVDDRRLRSGLLRRVRGMGRRPQLPEQPALAWVGRRAAGVDVDDVSHGPLHPAVVDDAWTRLPRMGYESDRLPRHQRRAARGKRRADLLRRAPAPATGGACAQIGTRRLAAHLCVGVCGARFRGPSTSCGIGGVDHRAARRAVRMLLHTHGGLLSPRPRRECHPALVLGRRRRVRVRPARQGQRDDRTGGAPHTQLLSAEAVAGPGRDLRR